MRLCTMWMNNSLVHPIWRLFSLPLILCCRSLSFHLHHPTLFLMLSVTLPFPLCLSLFPSCSWLYYFFFCYGLETDLDLVSFYKLFPDAIIIVVKIRIWLMEYSCTNFLETHKWIDLKLLSLEQCHFFFSCPFIVQCPLSGRWKLLKSSSRKFSRIPCMCVCVCACSWHWANVHQFAICLHTLTHISRARIFINCIYIMVCIDYEYIHLILLMAFYIFRWIFFNYYFYVRHSKIECKTLFVL